MVYNKQIRELSKIVSHALRHEPAYYGIKLDNEGWVEIINLVEAIRIKIKEFADITPNDIYCMVEKANKKRHEIKDSQIRAVYGHSTEASVEYSLTMPPQFLYHGTQKEKIPIILSNGLRPMKRLYVHLSSNTDVALMVARRKGHNSFIITINAIEAFNNGINFYFANDYIWLADYIPSEFIEIPNINET